MTRRVAASGGVAGKARDAAVCVLRPSEAGGLCVVSHTAAFAAAVGREGAEAGRLETTHLVPPALLALVERALSERSPQRAEIELEEPAARFLVVTAAPVDDDVVLCSVVDVTQHSDQERAATERLTMERRLAGRQRLESLGLLAGGVAHDFNNLLQTILGTVSMVRATLPGSSSGRSDLEQIETACLQASDLCRQLLTYAGQQNAVTEVLDLDDILLESQPLLSLTIHKKIALDTRPGKSLLPVRVDASQIRQVLMNLVINASEAIGDRSGRITIRTDSVRGDDPSIEALYLPPEDRGGDFVRLIVEDDGCGMDPETAQRIFEPFFSTKFTGRGLGLAATLGIVQKHGGGIGVRSVPGEGTAFALVLPATEGRPSRSLVPAGGVGWRGDGTILVVDDQDAVRHTAARLVEELGFRTVLARDGVEALELFALHDGKVDAVLLDLTMPRLDGAETLMRLRELRHDLPVILMSGYTEADLRQLTRDEMTGFLAKPFRATELADTLRRALGH